MTENTKIDPFFDLTLPLINVLAEAIGRSVEPQVKDAIVRNLREQAAHEADLATTRAHQLLAPLISVLAEAADGNPEKGLEILKAAVRRTPQ